MALGSLLQRWRRSPAPVSGFVYVADGEDGPLARARPGGTVAVNGAGPPWIIVDHGLEGMLVPSWPGRLLHVRVATPATEQSPPGAHAPYTRALSVDVLEELPPRVLFGNHGASVALVIESASTVTAEMAARLSEFRHFEIAEACARVWRRWLDRNGLTYPDVTDWVGTLAVPGQGLRSPVNNGLLLAHKAIFDQAIAIGGKDATRVNGDDVWLAEPWNGAALAAVEAALAFGAPELCGRWDARILFHAWLSVFGRA